MHLNIAICDDMESEINWLASQLRKWSVSGHSLQISTFTSAESFLFHYADHKDFDILLLDIEMGGINGIELAKQIRAVDSAIPIIFITGYSEYILEGYDVDALHYLLKPVQESKLYDTLNRAVQKLETNDKALFLESEGEMVRIALHEIRFIEVQHNNSTIHTDTSYIIRRTLRDLEEQLDDRFFRIQRSYLVNLDYVRRSTHKEVYLSDGTVLPLARGRYEALNRAIINIT